MVQNMIQKTPQKILKGDRISIPKKFLEKYDLEHGNFVIVQDTDKGLLIVPADVTPRPLK